MHIPILFLSFCSWKWGLNNGYLSVSCTTVTYQNPHTASHPCPSLQFWHTGHFYISGVYTERQKQAIHLGESPLCLLRTQWIFLDLIWGSANSLLTAITDNYDCPMIHNSEKIIFSLNPLLGYMSLYSNCPGSSKKATSLNLKVPVHSSSHRMCPHLPWEADTTLLFKDRSQCWLHPISGYTTKHLVYGSPQRTTTDRQCLPVGNTNRSITGDTGTF